MGWVKLADENGELAGWCKGTCWNLVLLVKKKTKAIFSI